MQPDQPARCDYSPGSAARSAGTDATTARAVQPDQPGQMRLQPGWSSQISRDRCDYSPGGAARSAGADATTARDGYLAQHGEIHFGHPELKRLRFPGVEQLLENGSTSRQNREK